MLRLLLLTVWDRIAVAVTVTVSVGRSREINCIASSENNNRGESWSQPVRLFIVNRLHLVSPAMTAAPPILSSHAPSARRFVGYIPVPLIVINVSWQGLNIMTDQVEADNHLHVKWSQPVTSAAYFMLFFGIPFSIRLPCFSPTPRHAIHLHFLHPYAPVPHLQHQY